jgi:hypothetical protein
MDRLNHPVYRNRLLQIVLDAGLAALAWYLAFQLRFVDLPNGIPGRYEEILTGFVPFRAGGEWHLWPTVVVSLIALEALAASVYIVVLLEILKLRRLRAWAERRREAKLEREQLRSA